MSLKANKYSGCRICEAFWDFVFSKVGYIYCVRQYGMFYEEYKYKQRLLTLNFVVSEVSICISTTW